MIESIDRDRARKNLETYTAIGLAFGNFEKADAMKQIDAWRQMLD